jgi:hypothetical protein
MLEHSEVRRTHINRIAVLGLGGEGCIEDDIS